MEQRNGDVDYRQLNFVTVSERYSLPNIFNTLDMLGESKYFSVIDMESIFHQIPLDKESQPKINFPLYFEGYLEYTRVLLGYKMGSQLISHLLGLNGHTLFVIS